MIRDAVSRLEAQPKNESGLELIGLEHLKDGNSGENNANERDHCENAHDHLTGSSDSNSEKTAAAKTHTRISQSKVDVFAYQE